MQGPELDAFMYRLRILGCPKACFVACSRSFPNSLMWMGVFLLNNLIDFISYDDASPASCMIQPPKIKTYTVYVLGGNGRHHLAGHVDFEHSSRGGDRHMGPGPV